MTTGERIRSARKAAGMTQKELGKKLGLSFQSIAQWENDLRNPKIETIKRIAAALGCDWVSLTEEDDPRVAPLIWEELRTSMESKNETTVEIPLRATFTETMGGRVRARIIAALDELNHDGLSKVADYAQDLAQMPKYQRQALAEGGESTPAPQEGNDTTPTPDTPETPTEGE